MRKLLLVLLISLSSLSYALHIECVGNAVLLDNSGDTLLVFQSAPELKTLPSVGMVDWYKLTDTINPVQTGTDYFYPEHGEGYMIKVGSQRDVFWVFDYEQLRPTITAIDAEMDCESTLLKLVGEIPQMQYTRRNGQMISMERKCRIEYRDASWDEASESWVDSVAVEEQSFASMVRVAASALPTEYAVSDLLAQQLGLQTDTIYSPTFNPIALKANPLTTTTTRGEASEQSNEVNRPTRPTDVAQMSAPLEVHFRANGLNAEYYRWRIYQGSQLLLTRNDAEHRYTFMEKGNYRAVVEVSNDHCVLDSVEFSISVSESMLLVPNVFTPNGDGANDEFRVVYRSIKEFHCWVYNRWGHLVYEWTDPSKGWDGTIGKRPAPEGAYFYVIRALGTAA